MILSGSHFFIKFNCLVIIKYSLSLIVLDIKILVLNKKENNSWSQMYWKCVNIAQKQFIH